MGTRHLYWILTGPSFAVWYSSYMPEIWAFPQLPHSKSSIFSLSTIHCKKSLATFPSPAGMSLTKLSLGVILQNSPWVGIIKLFQPRESLVSDIPAGDENGANLFLRCSLIVYKLYTAYLVFSTTSFLNLAMTLI
jgi:hypothetical protein